MQLPTKNEVFHILFGILLGGLIVFTICHVKDNRRDISCNQAIEAEHDLLRSKMVDLHQEKNEEWPSGWLSRSEMENRWLITVYEEECLDE